MNLTGSSGNRHCKKSLKDRSKKKQMATTVNWNEAIRPLLKKYKKTKHPLEYKSIYQLIVMVVLSAQDSDRNINKLAPELFKKFPGMAALSKATPAAMKPYISK